MRVYDVTMYELTFEEALKWCKQGRQVLVYNSFFEVFYCIAETEAVLKSTQKGVHKDILPCIKYFTFFTI